MRKLAFTTVCLIMFSTLQAQKSSDFGIGIGYTWAWSYWYRSQLDFNDQYPVHHHTFLSLNARYETAPIFQLGPLDVEIVLELTMGEGNTRADWISEDKKISKLVLYAGFNPEVKLLYTTNGFSPFIGLSFQGSAIYSDVANVTEALGSTRNYESFGEFFGGGGLNMGFEYQMEKIKIMPFYRSCWLGGYSNWYYVQENDKTNTIQSIGLYVLF